MSCGDGPAGRLVTTFVQPWHEDWCARTVRFDVREGRLAALRSLVRVPGPAVLNGASGFERGYVDLVATGIRARRGWPVLLADATWEPGSRVLDRITRTERPPGMDAPPRRGLGFSRAVIHAIDGGRVHYAVLSTYELSSFPPTWGVEPDRVHFTPFCATATDVGPAGDGRGVMASGNSLRDYRALVEATPRIEAPVTIATTLALSAPTMPAPNLTSGFLSSADHEEKMRAAAVVVVPLLSGSGRSAGQQTYLNAMLLGKPVIVTDAPGVRDYVRDGETGIIVPNEADALAAAVNRLLRDKEFAARLGDAARRSVLDAYTPRHYIDRLLALAECLVT